MLRPPARQRIGVLAAALWWGSLTALGFVIVPLLFAHLATPAAAGAMAAKLFSAQTWLSTGCAMLVLMAFNQPGHNPFQEAAHPGRRHTRRRASSAPAVRAAICGSGTLWARRCISRSGCARVSRFGA